MGRKRSTSNEASAPAAARHLVAAALSSALLAGCPTILIEVDGGPTDGGALVDGGADGGAPLPDAGECPAFPRVGLTIILVDDLSNTRICNGTVVADDGVEPETLQPSGGGGPNCSYFGIFRRGGTFDVTAEAPGYVPVTFPDAEVEVDACGESVPRSITLALEAAGPDAGPAADGGL